MIRLSRILITGLTLLFMCLIPGNISAAAVPNDFNLQVTPSPLVATVKPGVKTTLELKIRNGSNGAENLKIEPRSFKFDTNTGKVNLQDVTPPPIAAWITFSAPNFTVQPGEWFTQNITFNVPKDAGFSYSFALIISRQVNPNPAEGVRAINGSLAVFTLINVDRPGATSNLQLTNFSTSKKVYEYLPSTLSVRFSNQGNTIAQPSGNIFIERNAKDTTPLATLPVNAKQGYILPGTARTMTTQWSDGFPVYQTVTDASGKTSQKLVWNWGQLSKLRIGRYTAHLVAVYDQGGHDVPIEGTVTFWVIPWKILLVVLVVVLLVLFALFMLVRMIIRSIKKKRAKRAAKKTRKAKTPSDEGAPEKK